MKTCEMCIESYNGECIIGGGHVEICVDYKPSSKLKIKCRECGQEAYVPDFCLECDDCRMKLAAETLKDENGTF